MHTYIADSGSAMAMATMAHHRTKCVSLDQKINQKDQSKNRDDARFPEKHISFSR